MKMNKIIAPIEIIKIIAKHEPLYLLFALPQVILNSVLPLLYVYFPKLIIEQLTNGKPYGNIIKTILIYSGIILIINITNVFLKNKSGMRAITFSSKLKNEIGKIAMRLELKDIESPKSQNTIQMANKAADLTSAMGLVQNIVSNIITIIGLAYIIVQLDWIFMLLISISSILYMISVYSFYSHAKKLREIHAQEIRYGNYLYQIAYSEGGAKEIRLNNLQKWYMDKVKFYRNEMVSLQFKEFRRDVIRRIIRYILLAIQSLVVLLILADRYTNGLSIADFIMYYTTVTTLTSSLSSITEQIGNYNQQILNVSDYKNFMSMINIQENETIHYELDKVEIVFRNVSFTYPNTERKILDNINIKISDKEKLVIVGMNGAGKSTFIKLLCKFYQPTTGVITLNGVDIWDIPNNEYYKCISAVFQDFVNLSFTLKENITMNENADLERIDDIIENIKLKHRINELEHGYDTYITKSFDSDGIEFSGGQSQKIAIARSLYKDTPILILDEPTANLDPKAESEIYTDFFNMAKDKTTIFISHRLAASTIADNIAVFSDGKVIEYGSHNELIRINSVYSEMFQKQSENYNFNILDNVENV